MKVFVTGGSGFIGSHLVKTLLDNRHELKLLSRSEPRKNIEGVEIVVGDPLRPETIKGKLDLCDAVINLIGIIREFPSRGITYERFHYDATVNLATEAKNAGIGKWIQMSANGARVDGAVSEYQSSKFRAEEFLKSARFDLTIFRPSLVFGRPPPGKTEFCTQMLGIMKNSPVMPIFGDGRYLLQPVSVMDVASVFEKALHQNNDKPRIFHLGGREKFSYREVLDVIAKGAGLTPRIKIGLPYPLIRPFISLLGRFPLFPATVDQTDMLVEGNTLPETIFTDAFGIKPTEFSPENLEYLRG
jgi:NADH dehydrogenase